MISKRLVTCVVAWIVLKDVLCMPDPNQGGGGGGCGVVVNISLIFLKENYCNWIGILEVTEVVSNQLDSFNAS